MRGNWRLRWSHCPLSFVSFVIRKKFNAKVHREVYDRLKLPITRRCRFPNHHLPTPLSLSWDKI